MPVLLSFRKNVSCHVILRSEDPKSCALSCSCYAGLFEMYPPLEQARKRRHLSTRSTSRCQRREVVDGAESARKEPSLFFGLPAELRLGIYAMILLTRRASLALLRTCRRIDNEAHSILYQRRLTFRNKSSSPGLDEVRQLTSGK